MELLKQDYEEKIRNLEAEVKWVLISRFSQNILLIMAYIFFVSLCLLRLLISHYSRASRSDRATHEATISQLQQDLAAHNNHILLLARRLDEVNFEVESKCEAFVIQCIFIFSFPQFCYFNMQVSSSELWDHLFIIDRWCGGSGFERMSSGWTGRKKWIE